MKLVTYHHDAHGQGWQAGLLQGDRILNIGRLFGLSPSTSMLELLRQGQNALERLDERASQFAQEHASAVFVPRETAVPAWEANLRAPVPDPPSIRDFYAFEQHVAAGYRKRGREIPPAWYEVPVFYFGHTGNLYGPDESRSSKIVEVHLGHVRRKLQGLTGVDLIENRRGRGWILRPFH